jgi:hypothetical protein
MNPTYDNHARCKICARYTRLRHGMVRNWSSYCLLGNGYHACEDVTKDPDNCGYFINKKQKL